MWIKHSPTSLEQEMSKYKRYAKNVATMMLQKSTADGAMPIASCTTRTRANSLLQISGAQSCAVMQILKAQRPNFCCSSCYTMRAVFGLFFFCCMSTFLAQFRKSFINHEQQTENNVAECIMVFDHRSVYRDTYRSRSRS